MNEILQNALTGLISGAIAALFTAVLFRSRIRQELLVEYDKDLRKLRITQYAKLYSNFVVIARYSRERDPTYQDLKNLAGQMRDWFFGEGGLCLSEQSRPVYFEFKKLLDATVTSAGTVDMNTPVKGDRLREIVDAGSKVGAALAADVGTRKSALLF